jgi:hypothetical protein
MDAIAKSQLVRIEGLALTPLVGFEYAFDQPLKFSGVRFGGTRPPLVLFDLMQHQARKGILAILWHLPHKLDGMFETIAHRFNIIPRTRCVCARLPACLR